VCSVQECQRKVVARGLCDPHYRRARKAGEPMPPIKDRKSTVCSVDECQQRAHSQGLCGTHARRLRLYGDPMVTTRPYVKGGGRRFLASGYVAVWRPSHPLAGKTGYVLEHRMVAWDAGILTDAKDHVHHIDGDKTNNVPENLVAMDEAEHHRHHVAEQGFVINQYGRWPLQG